MERYEITKISDKEVTESTAKIVIWNTEERRVRKNYE